MANGHDALAVLIADLVVGLERGITGPPPDVEPEHFTTRGYERLIDAAAAECRAANSAHA